MKKILSILFLISALLECRAQTNINVIYSFLNGLNQNQKVVQVSFTPMSLGIFSNAYVVGDENYRVVTGNKFTNQMISGFGYRVKYFRQKDPDIVTAIFTNWFGTNVYGTVYATDYTAISTNLGNGIYAYSMAQADARFAPIGSSGSSSTITNIYITAQNNTGSTITNGSAVTVVAGTGSLPRIGLAQATTNYTAEGYDCIGLAATNIANGGTGLVCILGTVGSYNTDGWITGSTLWLSTNAGALTTNPPPANFCRTIVGVVARANSNNGVVLVQPQQASHVGDVTGFTNAVNALALSVAQSVVATNGGGGGNPNAITNITTYSMTFNAGETNPIYVYSQDRGTQVNGLYYWNAAIGRYTNNGSTNMMWKSLDNLGQWVVGGVTNDPANNQNILYYTGSDPDLPLNQPSSWLYLDGFGNTNATVLVGTKIATNTVIQLTHKGLTIYADDTGGNVETNAFAFSIKSISRQDLMTRNPAYSPLATFISPYDYVEPGPSFVPNSTTGTNGDGLNAYAWNLASQYNANSDKRFSVGVSFLHGTNGQNGSTFEILNQWRAGYNSANNNGGQFNRALVIDTKGGITVGDQPYAAHGRDVPSKFWFSIYSGNGDGVKPKLGIGRGNLVAIPVPDGYENDGTNTYYTDASTNRVRFLTSADTNAIIAQAGAAIAASNYLTSISVTTTNQFGLKTNAVLIGTATLNGANLLTNGAAASLTLTGGNALTNNQSGPVTIYGNDAKTNSWTFSSSGETRTNNGAGIGRTISLMTGTETWTGTNGSVNYVVYSSANNTVTFNGSHVGNGAGLTNVASTNIVGSSTLLTADSTGTNYIVNFAVNNRFILPRTTNVFLIAINASSLSSFGFIQVTNTATGAAAWSFTFDTNTFRAPSSQYLTMTTNSLARDLISVVPAPSGAMVWMVQTLNFQ